MLIMSAVAEQGRLERTVLIFGVGLVGSAVASAVKKRCTVLTQRLPFDWLDAKQRSAQKLAITRHVLDNAKGRIEVVWAAGQAGFGATPSVFEEEWKAFCDVLDIARRLANEKSQIDVSFHLLSSAGGLFEGQTFVDLDSIPKPRRPYGEAKLRQEAAVEDLPGHVGRLIYRPSTVYGYARGGRSGLITTLISNALTGKVTNIFGSPHTLRDFIFADDIGQFVCEKIFADISPDVTRFFLASAKPTAMVEIIGVVRNALQQPIYLQYDPVPSNALNNSFRASVLPAGLVTTSLVVGITKTAMLVRDLELLQQEY